MVALDGDEDAYAGKGRAAAQAAIACKGATVTAAFTGLTPGTYAVRAFHDLNGDGKLNTNPFGIPTEPYAFSRDARGAAAPPDWRRRRLRDQSRRQRPDHRHRLDLDTGTQP